MFEIEFDLGGLDADELESALTDAGAGSVTYLSLGGEPVLEPAPGEIRLFAETQVRVLFLEPPTAALGKLARLVVRLGDSLAETARLRTIADRKWERVWLEGWTSMRFGRRLWICPAEAAPPTDPGAVIVRLDPGLAFGTGTHPTTALCLQFLDALPMQGRSVIDYGCGSGILGLAALKLGAAHVTAVDIDPQACLATRDNAIRNEVSSRLDVLTAPARLHPADCVLSNILAGPLIDLAKVLTAACLAGGDLVLSGLLRTQAYAVKAAYAPSFDIVRLAEREEWCCIHARRKRDGGGSV